jgi:hypothetical protein
MDLINSQARWLIIGEDGRHVTLGRYNAPAEDEISKAEEAMTSQGLAGWLVRLNGEYYSRSKPEVTLLRALCQPKRRFENALADFESLRAQHIAA